MKPILFAIVVAAAAVDVPAADSVRGEKVFHTQGCVQCHAIDGKGGKEAPDLGRRIARGYTPALLASTMWNHAPSMWSVMRRVGVERQELDPASAADLLAFFSSSRFFEKPADAGRGKQVFQQKGCNGCHGIDKSIAAGAPPIIKWSSLGDPLGLAESMWNHAGRMKDQFASRGLAWPTLTSQELSDILLYLRNLPQTRRVPVRVQTASGGKGEALFQQKGCVRCHTGNLDLRSRAQGRTLTDLAAAMWNHAQQMDTSIRFEPGEMNEILTYLWSHRLLDARGNPKRGEKLFAEKQCSGCHNGAAGGAPDLRGSKKDEHTSLTMISSLWSHGPAMLDRMREKNLLWPRLTESDMTDLLAFLNTPK